MSTPERRANPPIDLNVIAYQVGAVQTSVDRGLAALEKTMERELAKVSGGLARVEERLHDLEINQAKVDERVSVLERYKAEQEEHERAEQAAKAAELRDAVNGSQTAKTLRLLGGLSVGLAALVGAIVAVAGLLG